MEEEKQQGIIRVGRGDEITEIIDKIKNVPGRIVVLIIPADAIVLQDVINLKILQKESEKLGKEISISKSGDAGFSGSEPSGTVSMSNISAQIPAISTNILKHEEKQKVAHGIFAESGKMSDMVKKSNTIDLRKMSVEKEEKRADLLKDEESVEKIHMEEAPLMSAPMENIPEFSIIPELPEEKKEIEEENYLQKIKENEGVSDRNFWGEMSSSSRMEKKDEDESENNERKVRRIERVEEPFGDIGGSDSDNKERKPFDFSYGGNQKKKRNSILPTISARVFAVFILFCIFTASLALFFILPKADIKVALQKENVKGDFTFVLDETSSAVDAVSGRIPATRTEISSNKTQTFATTSKKQVTANATGEITILNECSTGEQALIAGTRFLSKDGKIFKITEAATIPGFTKPEDKTVPGEKTMKVVAESAGDTYNIEATTFTIPKLQELSSWKYSCLYARSDKPMTGGMDKQVGYISQADYDKAKETLTASVKTENDTKVSQQKDDNSIFIDDKSDDGNLSAVLANSAKVGDVADNFDMTVTTKKSVLSIGKNNLESLLDKKIVALNNFQNATPVKGSLSYQLGDVTNKDKEISVAVSGSEDFTFALDQDKVKREISGKDRQQLNDYFSKMSGVKSVSVNLWPFWVSKVPDSVNKINITLEN
jgi:hypothetical protein